MMLPCLGDGLGEVNSTKCRIRGQNDPSAVASRSHLGNLVAAIPNDRGLPDDVSKQTEYDENAIFYSLFCFLSTLYRRILQYKHLKHNVTNAIDGVSTR